MSTAQKMTLTCTSKIYHNIQNHQLFSNLWGCLILTAQKMKFSIKFFPFDQICWKLRSWSHLLKKSLTQNFIFCAVYTVLIGKNYCGICQGGKYINSFEAWPTRTNKLLKGNGKNIAEQKYSIFWVSYSRFEVPYCNASCVKPLEKLSIS